MLRYRKPEKRQIWSVVLALAVFVCVAMMSVPSQKEREMQERIAGEILRFRVLANSDSREDQEEKQRVKDAVLEELEPVLSKAESREETREIVTAHMEEIRKTAEEIAGYGQIDVTLTTDWFPERVYGDCTFPEGRYETLRIRIGEAQGHNWWCVLYPGLCFSDAVHPVASGEGKEKLKKVLDEDAYDFILHPAETKIRFRWF